ncbi:MAG: oxygenase MpaB family protein [Chloroflexota bacterium]
MRLAPRRQPRPPQKEVTVLQRVNRERVVVLGWAPAILMQLAHPKVAAGVAEHSRFLDDPLARFRRLSRTIGVMQGLMFSGPEEMERTARKVNAIHGKVTGTLDSAAGSFPAGTPYQALDPDLLLWVFASLLYALPRTYELFVGPLSAEERNRFLADAVPVGVILRVPQERLPTDAAALDRYLASMLAGDVHTPSATGRDLVREILHPSWPRITYPLLWLASLPAIGLLPPALRRAYGLPWTKRHEQALQIMAWICRHILPLVPRRWRWWPAATGHAPKGRAARTAGPWRAGQSEQPLPSVGNPPSGTV